jgi:glycosyltransferase involved in cell wall biosynthesis
MPAPRFSVIITCHDQQEYIGEAVDSALSLCGAEKEIIVVDDGSRDGSQEILKAYRGSICFSALGENQGASAARNHGASLARGEYLVFLDGDDVFLPWAIQVYDKIIEARRPAVILGSLKWFEGDVPRVMSEDQPREIPFVEYADTLGRDRQYAACASALVVDRKAFGKVGGWPGGIAHNEDHDLILRLGESGRTIQVLSPCTTFHRGHADSLNNRISEAIGDLYTLFRKERAGEYPGGRHRRFERRALIGGYVVYWAKRAIKSGLYRDAVKLLADGWPLALAAVTRRLSVLLRGRHPCETIAV